MKTHPARPSAVSGRNAFPGHAHGRSRGAASLAVLALVLFAALPAEAQRAAPAPAGYPQGEVLIDSTVLDNLGRDPYGRAAPAAQQQRQPAVNPPAGTPRDWTPPPYAVVPPGGLLPPPGPGELERRQAEINAALGRAAPPPATPAAAPVKPAAAPAKQQPAQQKPAQQPAQQPTKQTAKTPPAKPAPAPAAAPRALPQFQQPAPMAATPAVPPLPGTAASAETLPPPPMAPPTATPQNFNAPPRPGVTAAPTTAAAPPPASTPMAAAAPTAITPQRPTQPQATPPQAAQPPAAPPQSPLRVAAPAPGAAPQPAQTQAQPASRTPPPAEPAPAFVPSGKSAARVNFMTGSSDLPENAKPQLKAVAEQMNRDGDMRVQLLAYAGPRDDTASQTRRLSLFRALAVRTYLIEQGIRSTRMDVRAMGNKYDEEPADRVDVVIADR